EPSVAQLPYWTWTIPKGVRPRFEAEGLGIIRRSVNWYPCDAINCLGEDFTGWMWNAVARWESDYYFGVRLSKLDGWHLGWIRLHWKYESEDRLGRVNLVSSAIHPEPGMPIRAG
ncbi:MAG: hypothetical protein ACYC23_09970, partial [Limisphaerales bacterium]